jgi:polysaccharide pyruvyl transferase WcaK-like protein
MKKVFLITKLKTTNVGNQALSEEIIKLFSRELGENSLCVHGRPMGLDGYTPSRIEGSKDPVVTLDKWATAIIEKFGKSRHKDEVFTSRIPPVKLIPAGGNTLRFEFIKRRLRPLKRFLGRFSSYHGIYAERLAIIDRSDWLIYSGAGEVGDNNVFLRQLLEIRVAQKLGKRTAAVNQSVVIKTPSYQTLVGHVYGKMDRVVVRGSISKRNLISYGVSESILSIAPDSALNSRSSGFSDILLRRGFSGSVVGLNFTPRVKLDVSMVKRLLDKLRASGKQVVFLTNEPYEDSIVGEWLQKKFGVEAVTNVCSYTEYAALLGKLEYLISTRLHSNVLALIAKTRVIPIEGNVFKTSELLEGVEYPIEVVDPTQENWMLKVLEEIQKIEHGHYDWEKYFGVTLPAHLTRVAENASWLKGI